MNFLKNPTRFLLPFLLIGLFATRVCDADIYPSLTDSIDPVLQQKLENVIESIGLGHAAKNKLLSLDLVDITDLEHLRGVSDLSSPGHL